MERTDTPNTPCPVDIICEDCAGEGCSTCSNQGYLVSDCINTLDCGSTGPATLCSACADVMRRAGWTL